MKWWQWVLLALVAWLVFFRRRGPTVNVGQEFAASDTPWAGRTDPSNASRPTRNPLTTQEIAVAQIAAQSWPIGAGDPYKSRLADQSKYPGFYITETGGFVNPDTGESYSPGSSPAVVQQIDWSAMPVYDAMPDQLNDAAAALDRGYITVF